METHHLGICGLDYAAHGIAKRRDIQPGRRRLPLDFKLTTIGRKPGTPGLLAVRVRFCLGVTKEIDVDRLAGQLPQLRDRLGCEPRLHDCATDRSQSSGLAHRRRKSDRAKSCHRGQDKRLLNSEEVNEASVWPHPQISSGPPSMHTTINVQNFSRDKFCPLKIEHGIDDFFWFRHTAKWMQLGEKFVSLRLVERRLGCAR
jgi:hypothetical protein